MADIRYAFLAEWFDATAQLMRRFTLTFYVSDNSVEMYDIKNRRTFLKRCACPGVGIKDLFVGSVINVYSRQLKLIDYADDFTRAKLGSKIEKTLAMVKPDAYLHLGKIYDAIIAAGLTVSKLRTVRLSQSDAADFYAEHQGKPFYPGLVSFMSSDVVTAMEVVGEGAVLKWRQLIGPTDVKKARSEAPQSLRARFGNVSESTRNACHGSDSTASASRELDFFFGGRSFPPTAQFNNDTLCIIKPHALPEAGRIIDVIFEEGFEISAAQMFTLQRGAAEEFLEVYKGVVPEYHGMVEELCNGACIVLEVRSENAVQAFRQLCGPPDPAIAQHISPRSLRVRFGVDKIKNAVHCTDLPEDGLLENEYFFQILQQ